MTAANKKVPGELPQPEGLAIDVAKQLLGCGRTTLLKMIADGQIRAVKLRGRTVVPRDEIRRVLSGR